MPPTPVPSSRDPVPPAFGSARRRRRRREAAEPSPPPGVRVGPETPRRPWVPAAWGLSPTFRVFLFLGGLLCIMAFLLYNEYVIQQFRAQERDRAELYANLYGLAISEAIPDTLSGEIFEKIIRNPSISFPMIVTDHRGGIFIWKGPGLPAWDDTSAAAKAELRLAMGRMDAANEPVAASWHSVARVRVRRHGENVVIEDPSGYAVAWSGPDLPASTDTTREARDLAQAALTAMRAGGELAEFAAGSQTTYYLVRSGADFVVADRGQPLTWGGPHFAGAQDAEAGRSRAREFYDRGAATREPVSFRISTEQVIHYGNTELLGRISVAPFVTVGVLLAFVIIGYVGSRNIRHSEQRSIWVGMAKETAHQLGTPLSALSGWLELMSSRVRDLPASGGPGSSAAESMDAIVGEMQRDMGRLNQIASRFSQIGSVPELRTGDVRDVIAETIHYFTSRGPQFGRHEFALDLEEVPAIPLNAELMGWVFENLFKNAMDAMAQTRGTIRVATAFDADARAVRILVEDDGRGIEPENLARVFQPGFSTKKRGWGLGLAFVRRIVEEYHGGRIRIPRSDVGRGTTFEITLPAA